MIIIKTMTLNILLGIMGPWQVLIILIIFLIPILIIVSIVRFINKKSKQSSIEQLEKLADLKQKGIISEEEFNKKKAKLL